MSGDLGGGGYHWQTKEHAARWAQRKQALSSERAAGFTSLLAQLPADTNVPLRIADLGAGDGKVAEVVLDNYPLAEAVLVDFSPVMMEKGARLLRRFEHRYRYSYWDMNAGDWPAELEGPFHAVVSSAALHHLENERKHWLAGAVLAHLAPGGVFANYDLFRHPAAVFADGDVHDRTCATLDEARQFLAEAGYRDVVVAARSARPARKGELALIAGRKPVAGS